MHILNQPTCPSQEEPTPDGSIERATTQSNEVTAPKDSVTQPPQAHGAPADTECSSDIQSCGSGIQMCRIDLQDCGKDIQHYPLQDLCTRCSPVSDELRASRAPSDETREIFQGHISSPQSGSGDDISITSSGSSLRDRQTVHSFSAPIAQEIGLTEALVFQGLVHKIEKFRNVRGPKRQMFYYDPATEIAKSYPYLTPKGIHDIIDRLVGHGWVELGNYNRRRKDRTRWITAPPDKRQRALETNDRRHFGIADAQQHGPRAALVLYNLESNQAYGRQDEPINISALAEYLVMDRGTVHRLLKELKESGVVESYLTTSGAASYRLVPQAGRLPACLPPATRVAPSRDSASSAPTRVTAPPSPGISLLQAMHSKAADLVRRNISLNPAESAVSSYKNEGLALIRKLSAQTLFSLQASARLPDDLLAGILTAAKEAHISLSEGAQELLLRAFDASLPCGADLMSRAGYQFHRSLGAKLKEIQAKMQQEGHKRSRQCSPSYADEEKADLAPRRKVQVLREAIQSFSAVPPRTEHGTIIRLVAPPKDLQLAETFFTLNPEFTPRIILDLMHQCAELPHAVSSPRDYDPLKIARWGSDLGLLVTHCGTVLKQLGRYDLLPMLNKDAPRPFRPMGVIPPPPPLAPEKIKFTFDSWQAQEDDAKRSVA